MRNTILWCLFLACLLITCDAKRRRRRGRWRGSVHAGWSQDAGWHVVAGLKFSFGKKRSAVSFKMCLTSDYATFVNHFLISNRMIRLVSMVTLLTTTN